MTLFSIHTRTQIFFFWEGPAHWYKLRRHLERAAGVYQRRAQHTRASRERGLPAQRHGTNFWKVLFKVISCSKCTRVLTRENETCQRSSSLTINVIACSSRSPNSPKSSIQWIYIVNILQGTDLWEFLIDARQHPARLPVAGGGRAEGGRALFPLFGTRIAEDGWLGHGGGRIQWDHLPHRHVHIFF